MSELSQMREDVKALVQRDELPTSTTVGRGAHGPCVFVSPGQPYLSRPEGTPFGSTLVTLEVLVVGPPGVNQEQADQLDELLLQVMADLDTDDDLIVGDAGRPGELTLNGQGPYLGAPITVSAVRRI